MDVPGEFSPIAESVLEHLSSHTNKETVEKLAGVLNHSFEDVRNGIEGLIVARLVKYKRMPTNTNTGVTYVNLQLTKDGERQAIIQRKRAKEIVVTITEVGALEEIKPMGSVS